MSSCINFDTNIKYLDVEDKCPVGSCYIYVLIDPITSEIRYVGKTWNRISTRLSCHCSFAGKRGILNYRSLNWIKGLKNKGLKPKIKVVDVVDISEWESSEVFYISHFKSLGFRLTNTLEGGQAGSVGGWKWSNETRKKRKLLNLERNNNINLIDLFGNYIIKDSNYMYIADFLKISRSKLFSLASSSCIIDGKYMILNSKNKNIDIKSIDLKRKHTMILVEKINDDFKEVFSSSKLAAKYLNVSQASISICVNKNKTINNYKISRYNGDMHSNK